MHLFRISSKLDHRPVSMIILLIQSSSVHIADQELRIIQIEVGDIPARVLSSTGQGSRTPESHE